MIIYKKLHGRLTESINVSGHPECHEDGRHGSREE